MDPNLIPEQVGLPDGYGQTEDGASHLLRLKRQLAESSCAASADTAPMYGAATTPTPVQKERRRSTRFACSGSVELHAEDNKVRMWGTLTDLSLHGCYAETSATLPVDTTVALVVDALGFRFRTSATVRASYPLLGMGMCFVEIEPEQQSQLKRILAALAGQRASLDNLPTQQSTLDLILAAADPSACLEQVAKFFVNNAILSCDEFYQIIRRSRRS